MSCWAHNFFLPPLAFTLILSVCTQQENMAQSSADPWREEKLAYIFFLCMLVVLAWDMKDAKDFRALKSARSLFTAHSAQCIQSFLSTFNSSFGSFLLSAIHLTFDFIKPIDKDLNNLNAAFCVFFSWHRWKDTQNCEDAFHAELEYDFFVCNRKRRKNERFSARRCCRLFNSTILQSWRSLNFLIKPYLGCCSRMLTSMRMYMVFTIESRKHTRSCAAKKT